MAPQAVHVSGIRSARYVSLVKTHFQYIATAAAINFARIVAWLDNILRTKTRTFRFAKLAPLPA